MSKTAKLLALFISVAFICTGNAYAEKKLTIQGSDTLLEMVTAEAATYMKSNPDSVIQVTGGGSGTGIAAIINGSTDMANASRPMKKKERKKIAKSGGKVFEVAVALDGISLYMHKDNPVDNLTMDQLKLIFTGRVNNWKELGGRDAKIIRYSRENSSGTYAFFKKHVLKKENYATDCQNMPGTASVVNAVSKDPNSIGYGGLSYAEGIKVAKVNGIAPSPETVSDGSYPVSRSLYQYTIGKPKGLAKDFIQYELSHDGQKLAVKAGYVPLPESARKKSLSSL